MRRCLPALLLLLSGCQSSPEPFSPNAAARAEIKNHEPDVPVLVDGNTTFALALYQQLAPKDGNVFFSPYSITNALAMTYAGARGNTAEEMKSTLHFPFDADRLHPTFGNLTLNLQGAGRARPYQLWIANRLWGQKDYGFRPEFIKVGKDFYHADLAELDYVSDPDGSRKTINAWVERQTNNKIKDLLPGGSVSGTTRLVLTNAVYFRAKWKDPFDAKRTAPDTFHLSATKTTQTPMMRSTPKVPFAEIKETLSLVELPYERDDLSMVILLPKKIDGLGELEKELSMVNLKKWLGQLRECEVDLKLPKFRVTAEFQLKNALSQLGMRDAFDPEKADFSGMATSDKLFISAAIHKAFVDVNEKETEAAAATAVVAVDTSAPPRLAEFYADHPFLFLIRERSSGTILFLGRYSQPDAR